MEGGFGGVEAEGAVGEGGGREADLGDGLGVIVAEEREGGEGGFGDGLSVAGYDFADEVEVVGVGAGEGDGVEDFGVRRWGGGRGRCVCRRGGSRRRGWCGLRSLRVLRWR